MRTRGFEIVSSYRSREIHLPQRRTKGSAGYDIEAAEDLIVPVGGYALAPTGLKAYMQESEYLGIHIRSSLAVKYQIACLNSQGIIDADYYNNKTNEGHIFVPLINFGKEDFFISKGMRIAQGIFYMYLTTDDDSLNEKKTREGGFGSTGE